jgi:hypothetical protein
MALWMTATEPSIYRYSPSQRIAATVAFVAAAAGIEAILADAATTRLILAIAAIVLAAIAITDFVFAPRLTATTTGVAIFAPSVRARLRWTEIDEIRVDERGHLGLANRALEIDTGDRLFVLSRRSLGRDPREVYDRLRQLQTEQ